MKDEESLLRRYITLEEAINTSTRERKNDYRDYINPNLARMLSLIGFDKTFIRAEGIRVWDAEGQCYLDFLGGYGALNLGHNPKSIYEAISKVQHLPNILQASINGITAALAKTLAMITPGDLKYTFFSNSGAESVECAIKMARASGKGRIVFCDNSFHGKTLGALSVTGREKYRKPFEPLLKNVISIPFNDSDALEDQLRGGEVAAFIVEPIQGEGGIRVPEEGYLKKARELCTEYKALLIVDEVQTGFGRTGEIFACQHEGITPDIMCLAKSLGGGVIPIGATVANEAVWKNAFGTMEKCLLHTSTFGGNTLAAAVGLAAIEVIYENNLAKEAKNKGEYFISKLKMLKEKYPIIKDVRGRGLMIGIEFEDHNHGLQRLSKEYLGSLIAGELFNKHRIITAYTLNNPNVIRLEPPLIVSYEEIDIVIGALEDVLKKNRSFFSLAIKNSKSFLNSVVK